MSKSKRRPAEKRPRGVVKHRSHRRNVKLKLKLGKFDHLPERPRKEGGDDAWGNGDD